jgi:hypothetical protein
MRLVEGELFAHEGTALPWFDIGIDDARRNLERAADNKIR